MTDIDAAASGTFRIVRAAAIVLPEAEFAAIGTAAAGA